MNLRKTMAGAVRFARDGWLIVGLLAINLCVAKVAPRAGAHFWHQRGDVRIGRQAQRRLLRLSTGRAGLPHNSFFLRQDFEQIDLGILRRLAGRSALVGLRRLVGYQVESPIDAMSEGKPVDRADEVIRGSTTNLAIVEALGVQIGFEARCFWQPLLVASPDRRG